MKKSWTQDWRDLLCDELSSHGIEYEFTSFTINRNYNTLRDYDWESKFQSGQIVDIILPSRKGGNLKLKSFDINGLPVEIGSISIYDNTKDFKKAIIGQLLTKELFYQNGDTRDCLQFDQPVILIDSETLPDSIIQSKVFKLKTKPKPQSAKTQSCLYLTLKTLAFFLIAPFIIAFLVKSC